VKVLSWPIILLLAIILIAQAYGQGDQTADWNVYCTGDNSQCGVAKEPTGQLMFKKLGPVDWDTAQAWMDEWRTNSKPAVWNVYCNGDNSQCTIAKEPTGQLMFKKLGPVDWDTAQAWMNAANSGGTSVNFMPVGKGTSYTYNNIPFEIDGVNLRVDSSQTQDSINLNGKRAKAVHLLDKAGYAISIPNDVRAGRVDVYYSDGTSDSLDLVMGGNIAEWAYDRPANQADLGHTKVTPAFSWPDTTGGQEYNGHLFYAHLDTNPEKTLDRIDLALDPSAGPMQIEVKAITLEESNLGQDKPAVWNVYCNGDNSQCTIAKEPTGQLMFKKLGPVDWDTAQSWMDEWRTNSKPAVWYIYCNGDNSQCTIAKEPTGELMFKVLGPVDWDTANAWMNG
jgi:predicted transglutaminase-like cysteine proteinase